MLAWAETIGNELQDAVEVGAISPRASSAAAPGSGLPKAQAVTVVSGSQGLVPPSAKPGQGL